MKNIFLILLTTFWATSAFAQTEKVKTVKAVRGEFSVVLALSDITGREAASNAREIAKRRALEEVCGSQINIWDQAEMSSSGDSFSSLSIIQMNGEIVEFKIIEEGNYQSEIRPTETIFYCIADVMVKKGNSPDPQFNVTVNGVKSVYFNGDILKFSVMPHLDCYMKIFLMENDQIGYMLYPNEYDKSALLLAGEEWNVENSPYYEFEITKSSNAEKEVNRLVFVFTKEQYAFDNTITSRADIEKWIATIPTDQKYLHFSIFEIRNS